VNVIDRLRRLRVLRLLNVALALLAALLAAAIVTTLTVDLGPAARQAAERLGSNAWKRPIHIGRLSIRLFGGHILVEDFSIEGLKPTDRPFFTAKHLELALDWSTLIQPAHWTQPEITIRSVEMTDWQMLVEKWADRSNFIKITNNDQPGGPRRFTTTLKYLRVWRGQFTYEDHESPWSVVARNIDLDMGNLPKYHGTVAFTGGTVAITQNVPFWANMKASYEIDEGKVHLNHIVFDTDGAVTNATGVVDLRNWPRQSYQFTSHVQFARMRQLFFKDEKWELSGEGDFTGVFQLFNGDPGRDLTGSFSSASFGVNDYRFSSLHGGLRWTRDVLDVHDATAKAFNGEARFSYTIAPLGKKEPPTSRLAASFARVDLSSVTDFAQLKGLRFAGTASGENVVLEWPLGGFSARHGGGTITVDPPPGLRPMTASLGAANLADAGHARHEWGPFAPSALPQHLPIAGNIAFRFDPDQVFVDDGQFATEHTFVSFRGTTAWGNTSQLAFHVTSDDWQESDELLVGIMGDFGSPHNPTTFGGRGEFDGTMIGPFRNPRIEGQFRGEDLRGFDTLWGGGSAHLVVENNYVRIADGVVRLNDSEMHFDGSFSLGFPRDDDGDEIDARIRVVRRDLDSLRHAFSIDEYPVSGLLSGEFHLSGQYLRPVGFGGMSIDHLAAYGEPLGPMTASLRFEGGGVRLDGINIEKDIGSISGAAFVGWDGTYSFNVDGKRIPIESIERLRFAKAPLTGLAEFSANGSATFEMPRNDFRFRVNDLFVGDEGVGQVTATLALRGSELSGEVDAASPRLAITATGRVGLTSKGNSEFVVRFHDMSLDPYVRPFVPRLSPFTTAVASGSIRVSGQLADLDHLSVDGTVDSLDMRLFDYGLKSPTPVRMSLESGAVKIEELRLEGEGTHLQLGGMVDLRGERIAVQASGDANLGILQGFFNDVRSSGTAELQAAVDGPLREPVFSGRATINDGRIRYFPLPSSLDAINGVISFDPRGVSLDELTAMIGGGTIQFGGRVGFEGYVPSELNVTIRGTGAQFRYPEGVRSVADADLTLSGTMKAPTLGGVVTVKEARYTRQVDAPETILDFALRRGAETGGGAPAASTNSVPLRYDVQIVVPSTLRIDNNIARGVLSADLTLRGTSDHPVFFGHAEIARGEVTYKGKRYKITRGTIDFTNPTRIEPFFDLEAETNVRVTGQNYIISVGITGPTQKLVPNLNSEPYLPAADILALLFSDVRRTEDVELRALQNPTQRQTDLLSASAAETIAKPITDASKLVQRTFGVDTFQLTPFLTDPNTQASRLNPTARLTIGKRISDNVYLTFSRSLASQINDQIILLEVDATERVSWIISRNEDSQSYALEFRVRHSF
jgi:hypothetical protein